MSKPPTKPPAGRKPPSKPPSKPTAAKPGQTARARRQFAIQSWAGGNHGERIVLYGKSGIGKTTLASLAPKPVFIGLDDGGRKITKPDGTPLEFVSGVESVEDFLDAVNQPGLFDGYETVVIDNATVLEALASDYAVEHYRTQKGGKVSNFRGFGWDGPGHLVDIFRQFLSALDQVVARGQHIVLLAQLGHKTVENPAGADYLEAGPALVHQRNASVRDLVCQWADHVWRIGYLNTDVEPQEGSKIGKVTSHDATRAVFCGAALHYIAKTRPIGGMHLPAVVSFETPADDTLWQGMADPSIFEETGDE